jgi:hypothetical protein
MRVWRAMRALTAVVIASVLLALPGAAHADLIGVPVDGHLGSANGVPGDPFSQFNNSSAIIGGGVEFSGDISDDLVTANFDPVTSILRIDFTHLDTGGSHTHGYSGFGAAFELDPSVQVLGFSLLPGNTLPISSFGFTGNLLDVNFTFLTFSGAGNQFAEFQIDAVPTPEPASLLAWGLLTGVGLAGYRFRRRKVTA